MNKKEKTDFFGNNQIQDKIGNDNNKFSGSLFNEDNKGKNCIIQNDRNPNANLFEAEKNEIKSDCNNNKKEELIKSNNIK